MADYRIGVQDPQLGGATLWYDQESKEDAHGILQLLRDYGRDDIAVTFQWRDPDGEWLDAPVRTR